MPKIDLAALQERSGSRYPAPHDEPCRGRRWKALGEPGGLTQFGVNLLVLDPGVWSSQRHWHTHEDELVYVLTGRPTMVTDAGADVLGPGDCAAFKAGVKDGHHFRNDTDEPVTLLVVGTRDDRDHGEYPDIDMRFEPGRYSGGGGFRRKDGSPFD
jgi:uncharacterized cupin superfamily protein